ncbi:hypothetical protein FXB40_47215 [Bradyrhizobium rifense]|uniref:Uncharacterized protein n=1 Tax=Bradyrhizobium rifense TaxID=515499 RepID=A0A5D3JWY2_9BRAD|nr:hypothetical protein FXB40_47215 [Bradyrhizobium rifense]
MEHQHLGSSGSRRRGHDAGRARRARIVIPGYSHHVTQRGSGRSRTFSGTATMRYCHRSCHGDGPSVRRAIQTSYNCHTMTLR